MSTPSKILCVDIEATCWDGRPPNKFPEQRNEIIEIGITPIDIKTKNIEQAESILVKPPTTEISPFCTSLTTITQEMIDADGIEYTDAMDILTSKYKAHRNVFASWGDYDRKSFENNCRWNNVQNPFGNMNLNVKALFAAIYGYNSRLDICAKDIGIEFEGTHHRGIDDSRVVAKVLVHLLGEEA